MNKKLSQWLITLAFIPAWIILTGFCQIAVLYLYSILTNNQDSVDSIAVQTELVPLLLMQVSMLISGVISVYIFWVIIQKQKLLDIGLRISKIWLKDLLLGIFTGLVLIVSVILILYYTNHLDLKHMGFNWKTICSYMLIFLMVSFNEELVTRGFLLGNFSRLSNKYFALVLVALLFSFAHFFNPNISFMGKINIFLAGLLMGVAYIYTRSLWFPIGLHFSWNFLLGPIAGSNVSGNAVQNPVFQQNISDNELLTGGSFGFEGSIILSIIVLLLTFAVGFYYRKRNVFNT